MRNISFSSIAPFVRFAQEVYILPSQNQITVQTYDHRLFYVISGTASVEIDGITKEISPGNVLYWMSETQYRFEIKRQETLHMISINFDFTQDCCKTVQYLPLVLPQDYDCSKRLENLVFTDAPILNAPIVLSALPAVLPYMQSITHEVATPALFSELHLSSLLSIVLNLICRAASQRQTTKKQISSYKQIVDYIHSHYAEPINNKLLADHFGYHPKYITQLITQHTGISLHQYLLKVRIRNAIYLLQSSNLPINEIAQQVGFKNTSYFSEYFRKCTGYSPTAFRVK